MHVLPGAEGHRKTGLASVSSAVRSVKVPADVLDSKQSMSEWRHTCGAPVVARPGHQVVTLHVSPERAARQAILKIRRAVGAAEARDDADVRIQVLNKLSFEPVVILASGYEVNPGSVNGGRGIAIELIGAVVCSLVRIADVKFVARVIAILSQRRRRANQRDQEQEKDSSHRGSLPA